MRQLPCLLIVALIGAPAMAEDWPQWRGPDRTEVSKETGLLKSWPSGGPKLLWKIDTLGIGHAGPAIADGKIYILGEPDQGKGEVLFCLDEATGKPVWAAPVGPHYDNGWGDGPRSTPTVDGKVVYAIGSKGDLVAVVAANGKVGWKQKLGGQVQSWGFTQSPLIDGKLVIAYEGGSGSIVAFDKLRGRPVWKSSRFGDNSHYSSLIAVTDNNIRQIIQLREKSVVSVAARNGKTVWTSEWPGRTAVIPTPIYHDGHVFVTSGYGVGCKLIQLGARGQTRDVYQNKNIKNHHGGVVLIDGHLYGHNDGGGWTCMDFKTGDVKWQDRGPGKGAICAADGMIYCYSEDNGTVVLAEASPAGWKQTGEFTIPQKTKHPRKSGKIWVHPVIANGKLYLRDNEFLFCYDISAQ